MVMFAAVLVLVSFVSVHGDYYCVCNAGMPASIYGTTDARTLAVGTIATNACKPTLQSQADQSWIAIVFRQQVSFVENGTLLQTQLCVGSPDSLDVGTPPTSSTTTTTTTTTMTITTPKPTTPKPTTPKPTTPTTTKLPVTAVHAHGYSCPLNLTSGTHGHVTIHGSICYEVVLEKHNWFSAENHCVSKGGHLVHIASSSEESHVASLLNIHLSDHSVWTGLNDQHNEGRYHWSSGDSVTYTKWQHHHSGNLHNFEDCVVFRENYSGIWDDVPCFFFHPSICQYDATHSSATGGLVG